MATCASFSHIRREARVADDQYRSRLTPLQFAVTRTAATEPPFSGQYNKHYESGIYTCICCNNPLFESKAKFDSGTGWPSYYQPIEGAVKENVDRNHGMVRREVVCSHCEAHLGHVFDDGPRQKTGLRYCINSASLNFLPESNNNNNNNKTDQVLVDHDNVCANPTTKSK